MRDLALPGWPHYSEEEAERVREVLLSNRVNYWTGAEGRAFEREFARSATTRHAVALANGTVALDLALHVLGIGAGDEVIVTPRTFIASASCIVNAGARPVFADVDPVSQNLTGESVRAVIGPRTRGVLCVHLAGWPCDMDEIAALARAYDLFVIEDCAQAHGASYRGQPVGGLGHVAAWSFCQDKIMTTGGEGGMLTTNDEDLWRRAWAYKDHGKSWDAVYSREHPPGFRWLHESFGTNWRMTEMQAAIGRIQLTRLPGWRERRAENAAWWRSALEGFPFIRLTDPPEHVQHAWYKYYAFVRPERLPNGWTRDGVIQALQSAGVPCMAGSCSEVYREKAFQDAGLAPETRLPVAGELGETSLMFPVHPTLLDEHMEQLAERVDEVLSRVR